MENSNYKNEIFEIKYLNSRYDLLTNYVPEPTRKTVCDLKDKVVSIFKTNTPKY